MQDDLEDMAMREALLDLEEGLERYAAAAEHQNRIIEETWCDMKRVGRKAVALVYFSILVLILVGWYVDNNNILTKVVGG